MLFSNFDWFFLLFQLIISLFFVPRLFSSFCLLWKYTLARHGSFGVLIMPVWSALEAVIWKLNVEIRTRKWNAQRWRMTKREAIQAHVSWRVSWCCSTALSHLPSQNSFKREKIYKQKISYFVTKDDRAEIRVQAQLSWRVSWCDSTVLSHFPSPNHFKMEKISTSRQFRILLPKKTARLRGPCGLATL